jgi:hypothetical protein
MIIDGLYIILALSGFQPFNYILPGLVLLTDITVTIAMAVQVLAINTFNYYNQHNVMIIIFT